MIHHLRAAGVSVVLDTRAAAVPAVVHWGRDLGDLTQSELVAIAEATVPAIPPSSIDAPLVVSALPALAGGWTGRPALTSYPPMTSLRLRDVHVEAHVVEATVACDVADLRLRWELTPEGVLLATLAIRNTADTPIAITSAAVLLPVPDRAREVLDFSGRWSAEREPQRIRPGHGVWLRESRHGRRGHDDPFLFAVGTPGFGFRGGEVWSAHVAWSGDAVMWCERSAMGPTVVGAGERLEREVVAPGEQYESPTVVATWSGTGIDGLSDRIHPWVRSWAGSKGPRPLTLNTWEAVYFDQSLERLEPLVEAAAEVGVERFVLDDGWFRGRTDDRRALGDWDVDPVRWPHGLGPLIERVRGAGMQFGLWVEPEMVSLDSDLARSHPDWLLTSADDVTWRWQHVLDLTREDAWKHIFARLDALLAEYPISYLKWDHNRDHLVPDSRAQVLAVYRLLDALREAHPGVEIESCASGGGRIDLGILRRVDRFWPSDTNDPLERQAIQRWTGVLVPPEFLGSHVGDARAHTTGRVASLSFRLITAVFLHAGIESDLTALPPHEREIVKEWAALYRRFRPLLHGGRVVRVDEPDPAVLQHGVVGEDGAEGLFAYVVAEMTDAALPPRLVLPGLRPDRRYRVSVIDVRPSPRVTQDAPPPWILHGAVLTGRVLGEGILAMPLLAPGNALLLHAVAVDTAPATQEEGS